MLYDKNQINVCTYNMKNKVYMAKCFGVWALFLVKISRKLCRNCILLDVCYLFWVGFVEILPIAVVIPGNDFSKIPSWLLITGTQNLSHLISCIYRERDLNMHVIYVLNFVRTVKATFMHGLSLNSPKAMKRILFQQGLRMNQENANGEG